MIEESYFKQRSRINWLKEGDLNTTFFFRTVQIRLNYNTIRSFVLPSGVILTDPLAMSAHAIQHFTSILGPRPTPLMEIVSPPAWFSSLVPYSCSLAERQLMILPPSEEEITSVMHKLNANKAPGPDGLTSGFYKSSWDILGNEVIHSIRHFFHTSFMPSATNSTILSLVPKYPGASKISEFRPISCLNTVYKVVSRLLVKRLKPILPSLIAPNQTCLGVFFCHA